MNQPEVVDPLLDVPTALPVGMDEFHEWADSIIQITGKFADEDSMKYALASQVIHLAHDKAFYPKRFFVNCLRKAAANQVASQVFQDIKLKKDAEIKKQVEDTTQAPIVAEVSTTDGTKTT
jgi:hypothetical protein